MAQGRGIAAAVAAIEDPAVTLSKMPNYFFHIYEDGHLVPDEEGSRCPDLEAAKREAAHSARDLARRALVTGEPVDALCVEIHDEQGRVLAALTAREVLSHPNAPGFNPACDVKRPGALH